MQTSTTDFSELQKLLDRAPITGLLGRRFVELNLDAGTLTVVFEGKDAFHNPARQIQGGMLCSMLDDVTAVLVTAALEPGAFCSTLSLNTSFLSPASSGPITGKAFFERRGNTISTVRGELWQNDTLIATATAVCMVRRPRVQKTG